MNTKYLVWGITQLAKDFVYYALYSEKYDIVGIVDTDVTKQGQIIGNWKVLPPEEGGELDYDFVAVATNRQSSRLEIRETLVSDYGLTMKQVIECDDIFRLCRDEYFARTVTDNLGNINGKALLDIGCGDGAILKYIAERSGVALACGCDIDTRPFKEENVEICEGSSDKLPYGDDSFDAIYTVSTFEHIPNHVDTLSEVLRVLKPGGVFYCSFGTSWSSCQGHHVQSEYMPWDTDELIPPWGHLYMTENEMKEYVRMRNSDPRCLEEIINRCYKELSPGYCGSNHVPYWKIKEAVFHSGLLIRKMRETVCNKRRNIPDYPESEMTPEIFAKIPKANYKVPSDLLVSGFELVMEKPKYYQNFYLYEEDADT